MSCVVLLCLSVVLCCLAFLSEHLMDDKVMIWATLCTILPPPSLQCITAVLEFPLSLTISVPAQIPNWSIVSDLTSGISKVKRSPLQVRTCEGYSSKQHFIFQLVVVSPQCREHLMNTVIPREDPTVKVMV